MLLLLLAALGMTDALPTGTPDSALPVIISPRVGLEIDARERRAFHLFPGVEGFTSAIFLRMPDESHAVELRTATEQTGRQYPVSPRQFRRIGYYIDHFEELIPELAALPEGQSMYFDLWEGIGGAPTGPGSVPRGAPGESPWANRIVDGFSAAACGLGLGGTIGAIRAIKFVESRQESVLTSACLTGKQYWYQYSVDVYDLDQNTYTAYAGTGLAVGTGAGWLVGRSRDRRNLADAIARRGVADYDFFGNPIAESEVRNRMQASNRIGWTALGASSGWVVGTVAGLLLTGIARNLIFQPTEWDTIIVRNDGFTLDLPLIAFALGGILQGAQSGYRKGKQADWREAVEAVKRERLRVRPRGQKSTP